MLSSQRRITEVQAHEIDLADDIGLNQKSSFNLMSRQVGGRDGIGYTILDAKNYLRTERQRSMAHKHKMPLIVFTDQDQAMAKALHEEGSCFLTDFKRCIYGFEDEAKFEEAWSNLLTQFNLHDNMWLKHMYSVKAKWAFCYIKAFTLACLEDKRYSELKCDFEARQKLPRLRLESSPMLQQLSKIYTASVFDLFQNEFILFAAAYIEHKDESGSLFEYVIRLINHDGEWRVTYDPSTKMIHCSCRRFEIIGLICCHSVKVFDVLDVKLLLENYILKRWTREARTSVVHDYVGNEVEENSEFQSVERYRRLCQMLIRLANEASVHQSTFSLVHETMPGLYKKVMEMCSKEDDQENRNNAKISSVVSHMMVSKAFKKKVGSKGSKRLKSWVELQPKRRKPNHKVQVVGAQNSLHIASPALPTSNACLERTGNYLSLTELLTHAHVSLIQLFDAALNGALEAHLASTIKIIEIHACTF
ncbi:hypothetical protein SASPL_111997 [Salvia splendens]|uniref:SWIM-type domain-containing protein n=1 Tax=Salvia splendens TaxID=180675 RepID=A0A8X8Y955_SALSN|nr:hypothetical protein SASPL_111997 [Salvia splendens]